MNYTFSNYIFSKRGQLIQLDRFSICLYISALNSLKKVKISFCGITFASKTLVSWKQTIDHKKIFFFSKYIVILSTWMINVFRDTFIASQYHTFKYVLIFLSGCYAKFSKKYPKHCCAKNIRSYYVEISFPATFMLLIMEMVNYTFSNYIFSKRGKLIQLDRFSICLYVNALNSLKKVKMLFCGITFASRTLVSWKRTIGRM